MYVIKRNGDKQLFDATKIEKMLTGACAHLEDSKKYVDTIMEKFSLRIYNEIPVEEIQSQLIDVTKNMITHEDVNYSLIAGKLLMSSYLGSLGELKSPSLLYKEGVESGLYEDNINLDDYYWLMDSIHYRNSDEYRYDYTSTSLWINRYLHKNETPVTVFIMIAARLALHSKVDKCIEDRLAFAQDIYDALTNNKISLATPFLMNLRLKNGNLSSCFVADTPDTMDGIYDAIKDFALVSKNGGGQGQYLGKLRAKGSMIKGKYGLADSIIPTASVFNQTAIFSNQNGKRAGAITLALPTWHADVLEFLELQTESGDLRRKAFDIFPQLVADDSFMRAVSSNDEYAIVCPHEVKDLLDIDLVNSTKDYNEFLINRLNNRVLKVGKVVRARQVFKSLVAALLVKGTPYMSFNDTIQRANPAKKIGTIKSSNLCVTGDTKILTRDGYREIQKLAGQTVECWNGTEWSMTPIFYTGQSGEVSEIGLANGLSIKATNYHKWYKAIQNDVGKLLRYVEVRTHELCIGDKLIKFGLEPVTHGTKELLLPYDNGLYSGDGTTQKSGSVRISLYGEKRNLVRHLSGHRAVTETKSTNKAGGTKVNVIYSKGVLMEKFFVPSVQYSVKSRLQWLAGLFDADGILTNNNGTESIQLVSIKKDFLSSLYLMLQELGIQAKINKVSDAGFKLLPKNDGSGKSGEYWCKEAYRIIIPGSELTKLVALGFRGHRIKPSGRIQQREAKQFIQVTSITPVDEVVDTFCGTEPKENKLTFNGQVTGNCTESHSVTNEEYTHVCNLLSVVLPNIEDDELAHIVYLGIHMLDIITDISTEPTEKARNHSRDFRVLGLGAMGGHDYLAKHNKTYDNMEFIEELFERIALYSLQASNNLAIKRGSFPRFSDSEYADDLVLTKDIEWFKENSQGHYEEWEKLFKNIKDYGLRNLQVNAYAPNSSTSLLMMVTAGMLPTYSKFHYDTSKMGSLPVFPKYLNEKFWYYKEYKHHNVIDLNTLVGKVTPWIDSGISYEWVLNLDNTSIHDLMDYYVDAWKKEIKTIYYVRWLRGDTISDKEECVSCSG